MKHRGTYLVTVLLLGLVSFSYAQPITVYRNFGSMRFERDTLNLTLRQVNDILSVNPHAAAEFKSARSYYQAGGILGFSGAVLLIIPFVSTIAGGETEWLFTAGGSAMLLASFPLNRTFRNRAENAVETYNAGLPATHRKVKFYFTGTAAGIRF